MQEVGGERGCGIGIVDRVDVDDVGAGHDGDALPGIKHGELCGRRSCLGEHGRPRAALDVRGGGECESWRRRISASRGDTCGKKRTVRHCSRDQRVVVGGQWAQQTRYVKLAERLLLHGLAVNVSNAAAMRRCQRTSTSR